MAPDPYKTTIKAIKWALLLLILFLIFLPSLIAPYAPEKLDVPYSLPSSLHPLGTNTIGEDNLTVLIYSSRTSLFIGLSTAVIASLLGGMLGIASGYHRGRLEKVIMAGTDLFILIPALPLLILLAAYSTPGPWGLVFILSLTSWPSMARVVRAAVLPFGDIGFVRSAKGLGASSLYITTRHILPHVKGVIMGKALTVVAGALAAEGGVTFLGLADPRTMSWGAMIHDAFTGGAFVNGAYWWYLPPVSAISFVVLVFTFLGRKIGEPEFPNLFADILTAPGKNEASLPPAQENILTIKNLTVRLTPFTKGPAHTALDNLSLHLREGERLALIGQTGGGKSILLAAILRLLPEKTLLTGEVCFKEKNILAMAAREISRFRAKDVAYVPQGTANSFNPLIKVGRQIIEAAVVHGNRNRREAEAQAISLLRRLGVSEPDLWMRTYPHHMSGGMVQRALVAAAIMSEAPLLLMDEPTKGLDSGSVNTVITELLNHSRQSFVVVTHDLSFVRRIATSVAVIHASCIVELCHRDAFFESPLHPYSQALRDALSEEEIAPLTRVDSMPNEGEDDECPFRPWCRQAFSACSQAPPMTEVSGQWVRCWKYVN